MLETRRLFISTLFSIIVIIAAIFVIAPFLRPLVWGAIIALVTWPIYRYIEKLLRYHSIAAALLSTIIVSLVMVFPIYWLINAVVHEAYGLVDYLTTINDHGIPPPPWISQFIIIRDYLPEFWHKYLEQPHGLSHLLKISPQQLSPVSQFLKMVGLQLLHRSVAAGFTLLSLFFFYKNGRAFVKQLNLVGEYCLQKRWALYAKNLPQALKATVNGAVLVGLGMGLILGISYAIIDAPMPALFGFLTGILAMIPFGAPLAVLIVTIILLINSNVFAAMFILIWGAVIIFIADHFIRPSIIGNATRLPFLAVLFGILGGVETMGLLGLFIGPCIMALFLTLWREPMMITRTTRET